DITLVVVVYRRWKFFFQDYRGSATKRSKSPHWATGEKSVSPSSDKRLCNPAKTLSQRQVVIDPRLWPAGPSRTNQSPACRRSSSVKIRGTDWLTFVRPSSFRSK